MRDTADFYSALATVFHLVYPDWEATIQRQASDLDNLIREQWGDASRRLLDVASGVGTQALGLAKLGYSVTASDIAEAAVERARREAEQRRLSIQFLVGDMREVSSHNLRPFDVVIACDNAVPHLLSDADILEAFKQFLQCLRPGGGCIVSVRDYEQEDLLKQQVRPFGVRESDGARWRSLVGLLGRAPHRSVGTEHAAVSRPRSQQRVAGGTLIESLARVRGHCVG